MNVPVKNKNPLRETFLNRFLREFFGNSAWFPLANILLEVLLEGFSQYVIRPDIYVLFSAAALQAYILTRWNTTDKPRRLLGNLIGPLLYTLVEFSIEGFEFFYSLNHVAYWVFSLIIGSLQFLSQRTRSNTLQGVFTLLENISRASILLVMYAIFENASSPNQYFDLGSFLSDPSHVFVTIAIPILGLSLGISDVIVKRYQTQLQEVSGKLKTYSEWSLGPKLLDQLLADSNALALRRVQRTVLFMDIRGFTRWSEHHAPEFVVDMLNQYYRESEEVLISLNARKYKFNADEVMAVFEDALTAIQAAEALQTRVSKWLAPYELGAGIGIHMGHLVEGLLGTRGVRIFDVIGDTVNTAKRLESAAERGEILLSETLFNAHQTGIATNQPREISVKGKTNSLNVYPLART